MINILSRTVSKIINSNQTEVDDATALSVSLRELLEITTLDELNAVLQQALCSEQKSTVSKAV